jgi:hypothetical protein
MRARNIKPGLFKNEILGSEDPLLTLLFEGLWCLADREGRLEDRPLRIRAEIFPYRGAADVPALLTCLDEEGFIRRYVVDGQPLIEVVNFAKHQTPHHREKDSTLPGPPVVSLGLDPGKPKEGPGLAPLIPDSLIPDSKNLSSDVGTPDQEKTSFYRQHQDVKKPAAKPSREAERLAALLQTEILRNKPDYRITPHQLRNWAVTAERMTRRDGRSAERIAEVIRWAQRDSFWMGNALSMEKVREKFDQLEIKMKQNGNHSQTVRKSTLPESLRIGGPRAASII